MNFVTLSFYSICLIFFRLYPHWLMLSVLFGDALCYTLLAVFLNMFICLLFPLSLVPAFKVDVHLLCP